VGETTLAKTMHTIRTINHFYYPTNALNYIKLRG